MPEKSKISKIQIGNQGYVDLILIRPQFTMDIEEPKVDGDCKLDDVFMKESTCATGKNESGPGTHSTCWSVFTRISDISQQPLPDTTTSCHEMTILSKRKIALIALKSVAQMQNRHKVPPATDIYCIYKVHQII
ncbi:hypothetical protein GCK72_023617 [Caenorhabditis remanei]|uniref:Uncharacterized protein n=1 Tax=Caenorhabditis remanei TaxID=31234 RepID=A0A6A5FX32_CAERE|nr:hypothetical protein GCK72_023617 [Caenorhabditis remanei]KAF1747156.1 hypothetical protein GCK72_023617 [Caenorhabditis remanei]